jgi:hypothetical protein
MPNKLSLARRSIQTILQALAAAASHSTTAELEYKTLKQFIDAHPDRQVFVLITKEEKRER